MMTGGLGTHLGCQVPEQSPGHVGPGPQHGRHHARLYSGLWLLRLEKIKEISLLYSFCLEKESD